MSNDKKEDKRPEKECIKRRRVFGRDERDALETQRRATAYGRARGLS